jgi:hypothetical protein
MENMRYELKYCEGCGTLKLQPVKAKADRCRVCEQMLTRFRFPQAARARIKQGLAGVLGFPVPQQDAQTAVTVASTGRSQ